MNVKVFNVWVNRMDGAARLRVEGRENAQWLIRRLSDFFVFKTSQPVLEIPNSSESSFLIAHSSELSGSRFEKLLAGIKEVTLNCEPALPASGTA